MKLKILGKYGPYPQVGGATSAYAISDEHTTVAFEFGAGAFSRFVAYKNIDSLDALILSHFHFDHCSDVGVLGYALQRLAAKNEAIKPLKIYCPFSDSPLSLAIAGMNAFEIIRVSDGDRVRIGSFDVRFYSVNHPVPCLGFTVSDGNSVFAYGGDSNESVNLERLLENADLALLDGGFLDTDWSESKPHMSVKKCCELAEKYGVKAIITHINPEYNEKDVIEEIGAASRLCCIAEENEEYEI